MLTALLTLQQADAAFPSGAFAFSNGVEGLAALPYPFDAAALRRHAEAAIRHRWAGTDRVALLHAFRANGGPARLAEIDGALEAATLAEPLRAGSRRAGRALLATHARLRTPHAEALRQAIAEGRLIGHLPVVQGCLWRALGLAEPQAVAISGYQAVAGLASAAVRLGRVGAIDAQAVVLDLLVTVEACAARPDPSGPEIAFDSFAPFLEVATMRAAGGGLRLFAN